MGFTTTVPGTARIGANRELKHAVEAYWAGRADTAELESVAAQLRRTQRQQLAAAGFDAITTGTFSYYDQMLDTAVLLGALPPRVAGIADRLDRYFAAARGTDGVLPLEMTKWFDTNYHYLVPEISADTEFSLDPEKVLAELAEATAEGLPARPVVIGPITFLGLSKGLAGVDPLDRIDDLLPLYANLLAQLAAAGASWVQLDEPILVTGSDDSFADLAERVYAHLSAVADRPKLLVQTYFGDARESLAALGRTGIEGVGVDLVAGSVDTVKTAGLGNKLVVAGIVDGHNIWRTDLDAALATLTDLRGYVGELAVGTSCSTLHVPYTLAPEADLDPALRGWLAFAAEKFDEVATLARALRNGRDSEAAAFDAARDALASRSTDARLHNA
ncbi:MAG: 5-methyltetrahydropteroyltriglutamate--homocysteine S-methyltransferase, partial [Gordonia sp. (in: high G+C Gram-positive bacteria)]